jgi:redox-sensitive bicupin YhaK (pirin superfamily)
MNAIASLNQSSHHLDDAMEALTFENYSWAFEETWRGTALLLQAAGAMHNDAVTQTPKGQTPPAGTLHNQRHQLSDLPASLSTLVNQLESIQAHFRAAVSPDSAHDLDASAVIDAVFQAWDEHDSLCRAHALVRYPHIVVRHNMSDHSDLCRDSENTSVAATSLAHIARENPAENSRARLVSQTVEQAVRTSLGQLTRRDALRMMAAGALIPWAACARAETSDGVAAAEASAVNPAPAAAPQTSVAPATVRNVTPLTDMQWPTSDPFLFCAYHVDDFPAGNENMGPAASLEGRAIGRDFESINNWNMYHGDIVPGFPRHPHRGFETVTVVRTGLLDHTDSMGATARFGEGDIQWLTAGGGIQHAEMFPLLRADAGNPLELFQIWLNLPARDKMVPSYFTMLWHERIPRITVRDANDRSIDITVGAGTWAGQRPPAPPPNSWASRPESDLAIWTLRMDSGAQFEFPAVLEGTERSIYVHRGNGAQVGGQQISNLNRIEVQGNGAITIIAGSAETEVLLLQGRPIGEPVARRGPFVMNTPEEIQQAYADFRQTGFGGWPWPADGPVHERTRGRFARHVDGRYEEPT